jgi:hypothetical protein
MIAVYQVDEIQEQISPLMGASGMDKWLVMGKSHQIF